MKNRKVTNRPSPKNEKQMIEAYKQANPKANKKDNKDISAVTTTKGEKEHGLLDPKNNRSRDNKIHIAKDVILDKDLKKKKMNRI